MKVKVKNFARKQVQKVKSFYNKIVWKLKGWRHAAKLWLDAKYFCLFELLTLKTMLLANKLVRKYIVMKGKDPDWVAPPPAPPAPTVEDVWKAPTRKNPQTIFSVHNEWVTDLSTHPVLKFRATWVPPGKSRAARNVEEPLQVTSFLRDNIKDTAKEYLQAVGEPEIPVHFEEELEKPVLSSSSLKEALNTINRLSDKIALEKSPVTTSTEGGLFRRVEKKTEE